MLMVCYSSLEHCHIKIRYHRNGDVDSYLTRKELNEIKNHPLDVVSRNGRWVKMTFVHLYNMYNLILKKLANL